MIRLLLCLKFWEQWLHVLSEHDYDLQLHLQSWPGLLCLPAVPLAEGVVPAYDATCDFHASGDLVA